MCSARADTEKTGTEVTDDVGASTFTDINMSDMAVNTGAPTSSVLQ
ncbi:unnamed protein product, partial [Adineta steineri]